MVLRETNPWLNCKAIFLHTWTNSTNSVVSYVRQVIVSYLFCVLCIFCVLCVCVCVCMLWALLPDLNKYIQKIHTYILYDNGKSHNLLQCSDNSIKSLNIGGRSVTVSISSETNSYSDRETRKNIAKWKKTSSKSWPSKSISTLRISFDIAMHFFFPFDKHNNSTLLSLVV